MSVEHGHGVLKGGGVVALGEDAAAGEIGLVDGVVDVEQVVRRALNDGVVDDRAGHLDPGVDLVVHGLQLVEVDGAGHVAGGIVRVGERGGDDAGADAAAEPVAQRLAAVKLDDEEDADGAHRHRQHRNHPQHNTGGTFHKKPHKQVIAGVNSFTEFAARKPRTN